MTTNPELPQTYQTLEVRDAGARVDLYLNRPEKRNALSFEVWDELKDCLERLHERTDVRVVVFSGKGKAFSAGVDFEAIRESLVREKTDYPRFIRRWAGVAHSFERLPCPVIARINGPAFGGALELALACDVRIAAEEAVFRFPQHSFGIVPDVGGTGRLTRIAGPAWAKDLVLTGRMLTAVEALGASIVTRVVPSARLDAEVDAVADVILKSPWPFGFFVKKAVEAGEETNPWLSNDIEAIVDRVMLHSEEMWRQVEEFTSKSPGGSKKR